MKFFQRLTKKPNGDNIAEEKRYLASQWQLMRRKFRKHKLAQIAMCILFFLYFCVIFCEFLAPYALNSRHIRYVYAPPQKIHFFDEDGFRFRPFVYGMKYTRNPETWRKIYTEDKSKRYDIQLFSRGDSYSMWGLLKMNIHLFGVDKKGTIFLLGTDRMGRDMLSRILYGARISLTIGLVGVFLSTCLGILFGSLSGYLGGNVDMFIERTIEILRSFPLIPLWLALSAAIPSHWNPIYVYFCITIILSLISWTSMARVIRGRILSLREEDYIMAARLSGCSSWQIIQRHLAPGCLSYILVAGTLALPRMILGETALSFLGLGLRPPITSWGVLLNEAQNVSVIANCPWLLIPGLFIIVAVLAFNLLGDGLRDAADPYK